MSELTSYHIDKEFFPNELRDVVAELKPDDELQAFVRDCEDHPHTSFDFLRLDALSLFMSDYEAHGRLGMYPMHLLSAEQWRELVPESARGGKLLDVGAGQGFVTVRAAPLFSEIHVTETARSMVKRLEAHGFVAITEDVSSNPHAFPAKEFDVISVLNVLDRCARPLSLLKNCIDFLKDDGVLIISDPLPFRQSVRSKLGGVEEKIDVRDSGIWETDFVNFYETALKPLGLRAVRISRLPYLYKSTKREPYVALDDFLVVCVKS